MTGYVQHHLWMERRIKQGHKQRQCPKCRKRVKRNRMKGKIMLIDDLRDLLVQKNKLEKQVFEGMKSFAPIGSVRFLRKGGHLIRGQILGHRGAADPCCKIKNIETGKSYWVSLCHFIQGLVCCAKGF